MLRILLTLLLLPLAAQAEVSLSGQFVADRRCPAMTSKNSGANPGGLMTQAGQRLEVLAQNRATDPTHYKVRWPGVVQPLRCVDLTCGHLASATPSPVTTTRPEATRTLLALTWQPTFCRTRNGRDKAECRALRRGAFPMADQRLSLHGLWPQEDDYCGPAPWTEADDRTDRAGRWSFVPQVPMRAQTRTALRPYMPGVDSYLDRHEWNKHGTCHYDPQGAEGYIADMLHLARLVEDTPLTAYLAANAGGTVTQTALWQAFERAVPGGAAHMRLTCTRIEGRMALSEIQLGLQGRITEASGLSDLLDRSRYPGQRLTQTGGRSNRPCPERLYLPKAG